MTTPSRRCGRWWRSTGGCWRESSSAIMMSSASASGSAWPKSWACCARDGCAASRDSQPAQHAASRKPASGEAPWASSAAAWRDWPPAARSRNAGYKVTLFERRPYLGGRASSYEHPGTGEVVDNCQHVLLGCCTNLLDLYRRLGVEDRIRWYDRLTYIEPGGRRGTLEPSGLPAPLHALPAFFKFPTALFARQAFDCDGNAVADEGVPADRRRLFPAVAQAARTDASAPSAVSGRPCW